MPNCNPNPLYGAIGCRPYFEIFKVKGVLNEFVYSNKDDKDQVKFYESSLGMIKLKLKQPLHLHGNILIQFKQIGTLMTSNLFRITFNTAFIDKKNKLLCDRA